MFGIHPFAKNRYTLSVSRTVLKNLCPYRDSNSQTGTSQRYNVYYWTPVYNQIFLCISLTIGRAVQYNGALEIARRWEQGQSNLHYLQRH